MALGQDGPHAALSLDGAWQIIFDQKNRGREATWHLDKSFMANPEIAPMLKAIKWMNDAK